MKKISLDTLPLHPFCLVAFPVLSFLGDNINEIVFTTVLRSLEVGLVTTLFIYLLFWLLTRSAPKAAVSTSFIVVMFTTFGYAYNAIHAALPKGSLLAQMNVMMAVWSTILIIGAWLLARKLRRPRPLNAIANVIGLVALATTLHPLGIYYGKILLSGPIPLKHPADLSLQTTAPAEKPDIYYIILDGYGRTDALREIHNVDNSEFLRFLESRGFTIAPQSTTNYARTMLSLSSSLNYHYLDELIESRPESNDYQAFRTLIKDSAVSRFLKSQGYRTVALATGYEITEVSGADVFYNGGQRMSYFEETLLSHTMAIAWVDQVTIENHRREVSQGFADLRSAIKLPGPKFVFAHLVLPHPPFVFDENGRPLAPRGWGDGTSYAGGPQHYLENYRRQLLYLDNVMEQLLVDIQNGSPNPPVIIVQGDHGPGAWVDWMSVDNTCLRERMPILNAYYLPGKEPVNIPANITPVNTFRLVLNRYFGADLPLLDNHNYFVLLPRPHDYMDVSAKLDQCPQMK